MNERITFISTFNDNNLEKIKQLYNYAKRNINLDREFRILIKSRNK